MTQRLEHDAQQDVGFPPEPELSHEQDELILATAARRVAAAVARRPGELTSAMLGDLARVPLYGAFVTLRRSGELRACCGAIGTTMMLAEALDHAARRAATDDPRFPPITEDELGQMEIDVSLLWGLKTATEHGPSREGLIEIGRHGLLIEGRGQRGLLLPIVAVEHHLDALNFLRHVCMKAGLPPDAWLDDDTELKIFEGRAIHGRLTAVLKAKRPAAVPDVRPPAVAGMFYPGAPEAIQRMLDDLFVGAPRTQPEAWPGAMVPHAGWTYSGAVAAKVYARLKIPGRVIVLCPKHQSGGAPWAVAPQRRWAIPGMEVESDPELAATLADAIPGLELDEVPHRHEHAIEVQLPMIARVAPWARVVGITIGGGDLRNLCWFGERLAAVLRPMADRPLLLISSDMNHFANDQQTRKVDRLALAAMRSLEPKELYETVDRHEISMCGVMPAVIVMEALRNLGLLSKFEQVAYATSAESSGDTDRVVGYAGVLLG